MAAMRLTTPGLRFRAAARCVSGFAPAVAQLREAPPVARCGAAGIDLERGAVVLHRPIELPYAQIHQAAIDQDGGAFAGGAAMSDDTASRRRRGRMGIFQVAP